MTPPPSARPCHEIQLDIRRLPPAEPMQRIFEALAGLPGRATLVVQAEHELFLLYEMLAADGWNRESRPRGRNGWDILIWRPEDEDES